MIAATTWVNSDGTIGGEKSQKTNARGVPFYGVPSQMQQAKHGRKASIAKRGGGGAPAELLFCQMISAVD